MDGDRFDAWTRSLVGPRRAALRALAGAALGAVLAVPSRIVEGAADHHGRGEGAAETKRRRRPPPTCKLERDAKAFVSTFTTRIKQQKLTLTTVDRVPLNPEGEQTSTTTIRRGRTLLLRIEQTSATSGRATIRTAYGAGFEGVEKSVFVETDGMVSGEVNRRAIVPFPAGEFPDPLQFQDGQPAPAMKAGERVARQIAQIIARAEAERPNCAATGGRATRAADRRVRPTGGYDPEQCRACIEDCREVQDVCVYSVLSGCAGVLLNPFAGPVQYAYCTFVGTRICILAEIACEFEECLDSPICCEDRDGYLPCHGVCCRTDRCTDDGCCEPPNGRCDLRCCPPFSTCCNGTCCSAGATCCNGTCCDGTCINGACCPAPNQNCGGTCCGNTCCNNVCCRPGESCVDGRCAVVCGPDFRPCPNEPGFRACCLRGLTCCQNGLCCAPGSACCPGAAEGCCGPGLECCIDAGGRYCASSCVA